MKYESSAGGVIVASRQNQLFVLLLKDKSGNWTFPKGLIEKGEDRKKTATREIAEEVGIKRLQLITSLNPIEYFYKWEGNLIKKKVFYYIFNDGGEGKLTPQREEGILDVAWFPWDRATEVIGYKQTNGPLLKEAKAKLGKLKNVSRGSKKTLP